MQGLETRIPPPAAFADALDRAHEQAAEKYGADDFGESDYLAGLQVLLVSMDYDPHFTEQGRAVAWGGVVGALAARAFAVREMRRWPGFAQNHIAAPLVITGIPRTGTTALHKLLALDSRLQGLDGWLIATPMPRPPRETWSSNPHFVEAVQLVEARYAATPEKRALHSMAADEVDECIGILRLGFVSNGWASGHSAATYDLWRQTQSELGCYEWMRRVYQLIGLNDPDRRWLLKNPGHIENLDCLLAVFPDAMVVQTHRDPGKAVPSLCSLLYKNHRIMEDPDRADLRARTLGIRETEKWSTAIRRSTPVREQHASQILDVIHGDFHREPMRTVERVYEFAGLELTPDVRAAMERRVDENPESALGTHSYDVKDFGTTEDAIRERFGDYVDRFGLRPGR